MTSNKKFLKDLKRPDSFQVKMMGYFTWIEKNKMQMAGLVAAIAVVCGGYFAWKYVSNARSEQRRQELAVVDFQFNEEAEVTAKQQQEIPLQPLGLH
jgi:hypothetical protein